MPLHVSNTCAHRQGVKIVLYSLWYHHTYRCDDIVQGVKVVLYSLWYHHTYRCDDTILTP